MIGNPLAGMVPALAAGRRAAAPPPKPFRWAWVASTGPLRIRYAAPADPVDADVTSLVPPSSLQVGQQVLVLNHDGELVLLGRVHHPTA